MSEFTLTTKEIEILMNWSGFVYRTMIKHLPESQSRTYPGIARAMAEQWGKA